MQAPRRVDSLILFQNPRGVWTLIASRLCVPYAIVLVSIPVGARIFNEESPSTPPTCYRTGTARSESLHNNKTGESQEEEKSGNQLKSNMMMMIHTVSVIGRRCSTRGSVQRPIFIAGST